MREETVGRAAGGAAGKTKRGDFGRQARFREVTPDPVRILPRGEAEANREIECEDHAEGDRLAMQQPVAKAGLGLERVAEGMTEIQQRAIPLLALVGGDD